MPHTSSTSDADLVSGSALFDREWYVSRYPDARQSGLDPAEHFLKHGASRLLSPGPHFDTATYLSKRPDLAEARTNPLLHFLKYSALEIEAPDYANLADRLADMGIDRDFGAAPETIQTVIDEMRRLLAGETAPVAPDEPIPSEDRRRSAVFVTHDLEVGGAQAVVLSIAEWFKRHTAYDVKIVAMADGPWRARFEAIAPVHVVGYRHVPDDALPTVKTRLRSFLHSEPDFVFVNSVASGDFCRIDPHLAPTFAYLHELQNVLDLFPHQYAQILRRADHIFCGGPAVAETLAEAEDVDSSKLSMVPAFIQVDGAPDRLTPRDKQQLRKDLGLNPDIRLVVGCGTVNWRKQPDAFVRIASLLETPGQFVWIGDGEDLEAMRALCRKLGVSDRVHFVGYQENFRKYLKAADVFALTSSEDPFPLVCLEAAAASAPSVIFREAGGMSLLVEPTDQPKAGIAVPLGDEAAFAQAVQDLLVDDELRMQYADTARSRTMVEFTASAACETILSRVRSVANLRPMVSVIVPAYNSAPFLHKRLESVFGQTFRDFEVLLLDDCSSDESLTILNEYDAKSVLSRVYPAEENGGSVFLAWKRGLDLAEGELIWIAEADDDCKLDFLQNLVKYFESTSGVHLAFGRSSIINNSDETVGDYQSYLDAVAPGLWDGSFVRPGHQFVINALGRGNVIPNASAVVTRRERALRAIDFAAKFRLAGDWAFYLAAIQGGQVAYVDDAINYHRRHPHTVTQSIEGSQLYFQELVAIGEFIRVCYGETEELSSHFDQLLARERKRFKFSDELPSVPPELVSSEPAMPKVLFGVGDLSSGGAQMFAVRFVNAWTRAGGDAVLFSCGNEPDHPAVRGTLDPAVPYVSANDIGEVGLSQFLDDWGLDTILTGHWWADKMVGRWLDEEPGIAVPWAIVMHGCHENVLDHSEMFPGYRDDLERMEKRAGLWIWTAEKNRRLFYEGLLKPNAEAHIVSGFQPTEFSPVTREKLGLPEDSMIFMLASRAIVEKGWKVALEAFEQVRSELQGTSDISLLLIGDGPVAEEIGNRGSIPGVYLVPHTGHLAEYICVSDVCLLPSWFSGESMPLVLIECLAQGKPVIVSDIGMCPWVITDVDTSEKAGFVVGREGPDGAVVAEDIAAAMREFVSDANLLERYSSVALGAFKKFSLNRMVDEYLTALKALHR